MGEGLPSGSFAGDRVEDHEQLPGHGNEGELWIPVVLGGGCAIASVLHPNLAWGPIEPSPPALEFAGCFTLGSVGPFESAALAMLMGSYFYGLFATVLSWLRAETPLLRRCNGLLALALGTRDVFWGWLFFAVVGATAMYGATPPVEYLKLGI